MSGRGPIGQAVSKILRPWHFCLLAGLLAMVGRLALLRLVPIPVPTYHDEFSYLLGADTFASGRITNPPHPLWVHFETFHVNPVPTYCSKYPPAQAAFLALGQVLWGHPWFGVCLSMGLMFAAVCWMLLGWVTQKYALLMTVLAISTWGFTSAWINSYWGGCVAATGGALLIGAVPRLAQKPAFGPALAASLGLAILANSRPFEGLVTACAAAVVLLVQIRRNKITVRALLTRSVIIPATLVIVGAAVGMTYYNFRTTGNALVMPYQINEQLYAASPVLYVFPLPPKVTYRHENIRRYWEDWLRGSSLESRARPYMVWVRCIVTFAGFYLLSPLGVALIAGPFLGWGPKVRDALTIAAPVVLCGMLVDRPLPHYLAPGLGAFLIIGAAGLERVGRWETAGIVILALLAGLAAGWCGVSIRAEAREAKKTPSGIATRPRLIERLQRWPGQHLVIVRYRADHDVHEEWVYNRANIDAARIVWAQDMGAERNRELLTYFRDRKVWLLQPDIDPLSLRAYR